MAELPKIDIEYLSELDRSNIACADCRNEKSLYASINHGILLCRYCASKHQSLGYNISYVRDIGNEWDHYLFSFIQRGGNERFIRFSNDYQLTTLPIQRKYCTKAMEYYRKLILSEIIADSPPELVMRNQSLLPCENNMIFPEFKSYEICKVEPSKSDRNIITLGGYFVYNAITSSGHFFYKHSKSAISYMAKQTLKGLNYSYNKIAYKTDENNASSNEIKADQNKIKIDTQPKLSQYATKYSRQDIYQNEQNPYPNLVEPPKNQNHQGYDQYIKNKYSNTQLFYQTFKNNDKQYQYYNNNPQVYNKNSSYVIGNNTTDIRQSNPSIMSQEFIPDNKYVDTPSIVSEPQSIIIKEDYITQHVKDNEYSLSPQPLKESDLRD